MVVIGLVLLLLGAGVGTGAYLSLRDETGLITLSALGFSRDAHPMELVGLGAVAMLLVWFGVALLAGAGRRRSRVRREEREAERVQELEDAVESERLNAEERLRQAGARDDDLRQREAALAGHLKEVQAREAELARREAEWRQHTDPSVADVVMGRAHGNVQQGTAGWSFPADSQ